MAACHHAMLQALEQGGQICATAAACRWMQERCGRRRTCVPPRRTTQAPLERRAMWPTSKCIAAPPAAASVDALRAAPAATPPAVHQLAVAKHSLQCGLLLLQKSNCRNAHATDNHAVTVALVLSNCHHCTAGRYKICALFYYASLVLRDLDTM